MGWLYRLVNMLISTDSRKKKEIEVFVMEPLCTNGQMQSVDNGCEVNILRLKWPYMRMPCLSTCYFVYRSFDLFQLLNLPSTHPVNEKWLPSIMFYS